MAVLLNPLAELRQKLSEHFNLSELRNLSHDLNIGHENFPENKEEFVRELVDHCKRHDLLETLISRCEKLRPHVSWKAYSGSQNFKQRRKIILENIPLPGGCSIRNLTILFAIVIIFTVGIITGSSLINNYPKTTVAAITPITSFDYSIRVQAAGSGENLSGARVTIEVRDENIAPKIELTDSNGLARIFIDSSRAGKPGRLIVEATEFNTYTQNIDLAVGNLPSIIQLVSNKITPTDFPSATQISTETITSTPVPLDTPTLTPSLIPTNTSTWTPSPTPTDPPTSTSTNTPIAPNIIANFDSCSGINNVGGTMGAAFTDSNFLVETFIPDNSTDCVARLEYRIDYWAAFWIKLQGANFSPHTALSFK
ncbi:MAG: hypothetical protein KC413_13650, partial [Anaerolineales bacterium]|nr:hypothetical protein [Anaerolineales bacterium]